MTTNGKASLAVILGSLAGLVTMGLHPTGSEIAANIAGGGHGALNRVVHSLALLGQPLILMGALALTLRFTAQRALAVAAYIVFAWASVAIMMATTASGFIATGLLEAGVDQQGTARDVVKNALHYTGLLNQAFAKVYIAFSSLAIVLWSAAMIRESNFSRGLAGYGIISGTVFLAGILSGYLGITIHGFGSVVLGQGVWLIWMALILRRIPDRAAPFSSDV